MRSVLTSMFAGIFVNCFALYITNCEICFFFFKLLQPCSMGFATGGKTFFLWGGCMMVIVLFSFIPKFTSENFQLCSCLLRSPYIYSRCMLMTSEMIIMVWFQSCEMEATQMI